jgi:hypothetical protein
MPPSTDGNLASWGGARTDDLRARPTSPSAPGSPAACPSRASLPHRRRSPYLTTNGLRRSTTPPLHRNNDTLSGGKRKRVNHEKTNVLLYLSPSSRIPNESGEPHSLRLPARRTRIRVSFVRPRCTAGRTGSRPARCQRRRRRCRYSCHTVGPSSGTAAALRPSQNAGPPDQCHWR